MMASSIPGDPPVPGPDIPPPNVPEPGPDTPRPDIPVPGPDIEPVPQETPAEPPITPDMPSPIRFFQLAAESLFRINRGYP